MRSRQQFALAPTSEHAIQQAIRESLGLETDLVIWRNNVGQASHWDPGSGRTLRVVYGLAPGSADLVGILAPRGRLLALEVKRPGEKARPDQEAWLALVRSCGGFACVVTSVAEARAALERARRGEAA